MNQNYLIGLPKIVLRASKQGKMPKELVNNADSPPDSISLELADEIKSYLCESVIHIKK